MNTLKQRLLTNWNMLRIVRLAIGIWTGVMAVMQKDVLAGLFSAFFLYQAIANISCCGVGGCYTPADVKGSKKEIEYENLK